MDDNTILIRRKCCKKKCKVYLRRIVTSVEISIGLGPPIQEENLEASEETFTVIWYSLSESSPKLVSSQTVHGDLTTGVQLEFVNVSLPNRFNWIVVSRNSQDLSKDHCDLLTTVFEGQPNVIRINERTTVATVFCFSRLSLISEGHFIIQRYDKTLAVAYGMRNNFAGEDGNLSDVITSNPNDEETNSFPMLNSLSTLVFYAITQETFLVDLLSLTGANDILTALQEIALHPWDNVSALYDLIDNEPVVFTPALNTLVLPFWKPSTVPNQWTLAIKFNNTGSKNFIPGGPGFLTIDKNNRLWFNNNTRQGTPNSSTFCVVLESNGQPADFSPIFGGGLLGAGFGIATNPSRDLIAIGNFGWGVTDYNPQEGSVSLIDCNGTLRSPPNGFVQGGFARAQGVFYDRFGNLWICGWGSQSPLGDLDNSGTTFDFPNINSSVTVYIGGDPNQNDTFEFDNPFFGTFDVFVDNDGNAYVSNSGDVSSNVQSSVYHFRLVENKITVVNVWNSPSVDGLRQIIISPMSGLVYVASVIRNSVLQFSKDLTLLDEFDQSLDAPWGIIFDQEGTLFVSNFRADSFVVDPTTFDMEGLFALTVIFNEDKTNTQRLSLPTGGSQILLNNGFPLYGSNSMPSFEPLMRLTSSRVAADGSLYVCNNWKPALLNDLLSNPGGDGYVCFIGVASPSGE